MTREQLLKLWPHASESTIRANLSHGEISCPVSQQAVKPYPGKPYTAAENEIIAGYYRDRVGKPIDLHELAKLVDRSRWSVAMQASRIGVCSPSRPKTLEHVSKCIESKTIIGANLTPEDRRKISERGVEWHKNNPHPRGMLGKFHSQEAKDSISACNKGSTVPRERVMRQLKTRLHRYGSLAAPRNGTTWKAAWRTIGGKEKYFRSRWEANYARYLEFQKQNSLIKDWHHECETFWFDGIARGCVSYLPDFKVIMPDGSIEYHEVKGWMDAASKTKIKRMAKYHPQITLRIFDSAWYNANRKRLAQIIKDWE